jgi:hypothetical protein
LRATSALTNTGLSGLTLGKQLDVSISNLVDDVKEKSTRFILRPIDRQQIDKDAARNERERVENMHPLRLIGDETMQINLRSIVVMDHEP